MRQTSITLAIRTHGKGLTDITNSVDAQVRDSGIGNGLATLFCRHTSASLLIQENASPAAHRDIAAYFERIAPESDDYEHDDEGPDDMPAHLRAALTQTQLTIPLVHGALALGRWQGIFLFEHRRAPQEREVVVHVIGE
jgi:secondary thiamine-phosphate synthase enzyme